MAGPAAATTASARQAWLTEALNAQGRIDVADAAAALGVAQETIRRDLRTLESAGRLQRVHGGAVLSEVDYPIAAPLARVSVPDFGRAEVAVAARVWATLPREGSIFLGTGRLAQCLAQAIAAGPPKGRGLTVVTNSLDTAIALSQVAELSVHNVGGGVNAATRAQEGAWAVDELSRLHVDISVLNPAGVSVEHGLSEATAAAAAVAAAAVSASSRILVLADAAVIGRPAFVRFAGLDAVAELVIAGTPDPRLLQPFFDAGVAVVVAPGGTATDTGSRTAGGLVPAPPVDFATPELSS